MIGRMCRSTGLAWHAAVMMVALLAIPLVHGQDGDPEFVDPGEYDPVLWEFMTSTGAPPEGSDPLNPDDGFYTMTRGDEVDCPPLPRLSALAATSNQRAVAARLDTLGSAVAPSTANLQLQISSLSFPGRTAALAHLSGEVYGTLQTAGQQIGQQSLHVIGNRLVNNDLFLNEGDSILMSAVTPTTTPDVIVRGQHGMRDILGWVQGFGSSGDLAGNGNASSAGFGTGGIAYGLDLGRDESSLIGIAGSHGRTTLATDLGDSAQITSHQISLYGLQRYESAYGMFILNYGHNSNDVSRMINLGNVNTVANGSFSGNQFGSYGELGINLDGSVLRFQPLTALQYVLVSNGSVVEDGGGGAGLSVSSATLSTLQMHLGARLIAHGLVDRRGRVWTPYVNGRWAVDLLGESAVASAALTGGPAGASWTVWGNQSGRNFGQLGPGMTLQLNRWLTLFANYDFQWGARYSNHMGGGGAVLIF